MANLIVPGYSVPIANKYLVIFDHQGPASYTIASVTAPVTTGGDVVNASDINMGGFDYVEVDATDPTGQLWAYVQHIGAGTGNAIKQIRLVWMSRVTATIGGQAQTAGAQVATTTNLSAITLRLRAWCV